MGDAQIAINESIVRNLFSNEKDALFHFCRELVSHLFPKEIADDAAGRFFDEVVEVFRSSVPILRQIYRDAPNWGREIAARDVLFAGETELNDLDDYSLKVINERLKSNVTTVVRRCKENDGHWTISNPLATAGHILLQNEYIATYGDRPYRAEASLSINPIGSADLVVLDASNPASARGYIERESDKSVDLLEVFQSWLHLVRRKYSYSKEAIEAVWKQMAPRSSTEGLDEIDLPDDPDAEWREYSLCRKFVCRHEKPNTIMYLIRHYHPAERAYRGVIYSIDKRRYDEQGRFIIGGPVDKYLVKKGLYFDGFTWEQMVELVSTLAKSPDEEHLDLALRFRDRWLSSPSSKHFVG